MRRDAVVVALSGETHRGQATMTVRNARKPARVADRMESQMFTILGSKKKLGRDLTGCDFRENNANQMIWETFGNLKSLVYEYIFRKRVYFLECCANM